MFPARLERDARITVFEYVNRSDARLIPRFTGCYETRGRRSLLDMGPLQGLNRLRKKAFVVGRDQ